MNGTRYKIEHPSNES